MPRPRHTGFQHGLHFPWALKQLKLSDSTASPSGLAPGLFSQCCLPHHCPSHQSYNACSSRSGAGCGSLERRRCLVYRDHTEQLFCLVHSPPQRMYLRAEGPGGSPGKALALGSAGCLTLLELSLILSTSVILNISLPPTLLRPTLTWLTHPAAESSPSPVVFVWTAVWG